MTRAGAELVARLERWAATRDELVDECALFGACEVAVKALRAGYAYDEAFRIGTDVYEAIIEGEAIPPHGASVEP